MPYKVHNYETGEVIKASDLNAMDNQIKENADAITSVDTRITETANELIGSMNTFFSEINGTIQNIGNVAYASEKRRNFVRGISSRGITTNAAENTMKAFENAYNKGYKYILSDIKFTSDGVPVLCKMNDISTVSNGTGSVSDYTLQAIKELSFGTYTDPFGDTETLRIPTLEEFMIFCRNKGVCPYFGMTDSDTAKITTAMDIIKKYHMIDKAVIKSTDKAVLNAIASVNDRITLAYDVVVSASAITYLKTLKNETREVRFYTSSPYFTDARATLCMNDNIDVDVTTSSLNEVNSAHPYASGIISNLADASVYFLSN